MSQIPPQDEFFALFKSPGLHVPEIRHLLNTSESLIVTRGSKTVQALAGVHPWGAGRSCLSRFFSGKWDPECLLDAGRQALLDQWNEPPPKPESQTIIYHIIDDTANPHSPARPGVPWRERGARAMEAVDFHYDHNEGRSIQAHTTVTSHVVFGSWSVPWKQEFYRREADCARSGVTFRSKIDIACDWIKAFTPPAAAGRVIHLVDTWYMNSAMIRAARACGAAHTLIGAVKENAVAAVNGRRMKLRDAARALHSKDLDLVTVEGVEYECWRCEGELFGEPDMAVVAVRERGKTKWKFIASSDRAMSAAGMIRHYGVRWEIETGHWYLKCTLGFSDYRLRALDAVRRFHGEVVFTYWYLEWLRHCSKLPSLADAERVFIKDFERRYDLELWRRTRDCKTPEEVAQALGYVA